MEPKIFISYARADAGRVDPTVQELRIHGFDVWQDRNNLRGGEYWAAEITQAITGCDFFVLFLSETSMKSDSVRREVGIANSGKRRIIPVRLDSAIIPAELQYQLTGIQWIDTRDANWISRLLLALRENGTSPPLAPDRGEPASTAPSGGNSLHVGGNITNSTIRQTIHFERNRKK